MPRRALNLTLQSGPDAVRRDVAIENAVVAGWTGRDATAVEKHIRELEALGVKRPASTPIFYRVSAARLTTDAEIEVVGEKSGGEVEFVLLRHGGRMWVGTGSDHTDREVETYGVTVSKQMCDKPIASAFWAFDEVAPHWTSSSCARTSPRMARACSTRRARSPRCCRPPTCSGAGRRTAASPTTR